MTRLAILALALGAITGCSRHARSSDKAADEVAAQQKDVNEESAKVHRKTVELDRDTASFDTRREFRLIGLRAEHAMVAPQGEMIESLSAQLPITDAGRKDIDAKVDVFQKRSAEAATSISNLETATPGEWTERDGAADDAMKKLETARDDAWKAFKEAKRAEHRSS